MRLTANVTDNVQVRDVEFFVDDVLVATDGNYPFEVRLIAPGLSPTRTSFKLRAKATDTGGNATFSEEVTLLLVKDATPPTARPLQPAPNGVAGNVRTVAITFNEPVDGATVAPRLRVYSAGADDTLGTADDLSFEGDFTLRNDGTAAFVQFANPLPAGRYAATLQPGVTDLAGNATTRSLSWNFRALEGEDTDQDGMIDSFEQLNGFDPAVRDQNGNSLADGLDDSDNDGVPNYVEMLLGLNPRDAFTFPPTRDNQLDRDGDYLPDWREAALGTDPLKPDTDGDLFTDEAEVTAGSNPLDPQSYPLGMRPGPTTVQVLNLSPDGLFVVGRPSLEAVIVSTASGTTFAYGRPPVEVVALGRATNAPSFAFGRPPIEAVVLSTVAMKTFVLGKPPVEVFAPGRSTNSLPQFFYGRPEIEVRDE